MTKLHDLYFQYGQSPWIDDLRRSYVETDELELLIENGVRGLTSNPTIMAKSIASGTDYDKQFQSLIKSGKNVNETYWEMVFFDAKGALEKLLGVYGDSRGQDGFLSVEVEPGLAHDTQGTIDAARWLSKTIGAPNLLVKIPATKEGLPAIEEMIAEGISINATLIFSLDRYAAVVDAYLNGLERYAASGKDLSRVTSVASFFVSRVDSEADKRLGALIDSADSEVLADRAKTLLGKTAVAQAVIAYALFKDKFSSERFMALKAQGATLQRPLWASTSTKNPAYPDLLYVNELIGPDTVNTMPRATLDAFLDHGVPRRTIDAQQPNGRSVVEEAQDTLDALSEVGVSLFDVTEQLEKEGVAAFAKSFDELMTQLNGKAASL